jgi:A/G-specific adenine glycosylase
VHEDFLEEYGHQINLQEFRENLIAWGRDNLREFPWRFTSDPYYILMAEVMLHRTNALQVLPVYERFLKLYPDLAALSRATEEDLYEVLYSLGLRWRVKLIYEMAIELMDRFDGRIPSEKEDLLSLPGVSDYIASAVCCFAWKQPQAIIDTNTVRIIARVFGLTIKDSLRRNRRFKDLLNALVEPLQPGAYNYSLLDLANRICFKVQEPNCLDCPVSNHCQYGITKIEASAKD